MLDMTVDHHGDDIVPLHSNAVISTTNNNESILNENITQPDSQETLEEEKDENENNNYSFPGVKPKIDLTFAGAKYPNGTLGLVANPGPQRLSRFNRTNLGMISSDSNDNAICPSTEYGIEGEGGHKILLKVKRGLEKSRKFLQSQLKAINNTKSDLPNALNANLTSTILVGPNNVTARAKRSRILCLIYTTHLPPSYENLNLKAQAETWGAECDGFIAASNLTDDSVGSIDLVHNGPESYSNMWQKVRSIWAYAYQHYRNDFDYFHICGDDVYIVMDNFRAYLDGPEITRLENGYKDRLSRNYAPWKPEMGPRPLLLGTPRLHKRGIVIAGGPGYTLNRAALEILHERLPHRFPDARDSREDIFLAGSLQNTLSMSDTTDSNGSKRYGESADFLFNFNGKAPDAPKIFARVFKMPPLPLGIDVVSEQFISFHLKLEKWKLPNLIYRYHAILHDWCNANDAVPLNISKPVHLDYLHDTSIET